MLGAQLQPDGGEDAVGTLNLTSAAIPWGGADTRGRTLFVKLGGTAFDHVYVEGTVNGTDYLTVIDAWGEPAPDLVGSTTAIVVLGANYREIRVRGDGGGETSTITAELL